MVSCSNWNGESYRCEVRATLVWCVPGAGRSLGCIRHRVRGSWSTETSCGSLPDPTYSADELPQALTACTTAAILVTSMPNHSDGGTESLLIV